MIAAGSRYQTGVVVRITLPDGTYRLALYVQRYSSARSVRYRYQTTVEGDRFDLLANQEYGDPMLWWVLARANPEIFYPDEIPPGVVIRIPDAASIR